MTNKIISNTETLEYAHTKIDCWIADINDLNSCSKIRIQYKFPHHGNFQNIVTFTKNPGSSLYPKVEVIFWQFNSSIKDYHLAKRLIHHCQEIDA